MTPAANPDDNIWPEDPLNCLACVTFLHVVRSFTKSVLDPIAFQEQKKHAPDEWSFSSLEEQEEQDPTDGEKCFKIWQRNSFKYPSLSCGNRRRVSRTARKSEYTALGGFS